MNYKVFYGLESETLEAVRRNTPMCHGSLDYALLEALITEDAGSLIVFELTGDDGTHLNREQIKEVVARRRDELLRKLPTSYPSAHVKPTGS
jgi:hypothetical protein